ncbi:DUF4190 domain-containing protein [Microbacterium sp. SL62]|uniref:DUF4190 domain-containing protein n=1 Tax=Microbacterium sp. SL62 TaxID=2995139 RepID=UPI002276EC55|nr:DUF4190 domain-containing protein [Microbacterium sp. SL62]MCY1717107.1 DUF4190 domain-containing protein [Microbacterium sp. SL62]
MSDDRTTDPQHPDDTGSDSTSGGDTSSSPYAPQSDGVPGYDSPAAPATPPSEAAGSSASAPPYGSSTEGAATGGAAPYGTPAPDAPAYGTPAAPAHGTPAPLAYGTPAPDAPAYGTPAAPAYGTAYGTPAPEAPAYGAPAYGQPTTSTYGQPAYGTPNAGYGYGGGYTAPARTNVLAIISLVASLVGFVLILPVVGSIAGVIMGHISLKQIKDRGERGRGMALAGVIIGYVTLLFVILFVIGISILIASAGTSGSRYGA